MIALFLLAAPASGLAVGRHVPEISSAHHAQRHRNSPARRRRKRTAKDTSAAHSTKKVTTRHLRTSGPAVATPQSAISSSSAATSPTSESFPQELFPAQTPAPKEQTPETPAQLPAPKEPTETPLPKESSKSSPPEESAKTPTSKEPVTPPTPEEPAKSPGFEEKTKAPAPEETSKSPAPEEPAKSPNPKEPVTPPGPEEPTTKEAPSEPISTKQRKLVWSDEFSGPAGSSPGPQWQFDTGGNGWGNEELESYTSRPANAELDGQGHLAITARVEKYTGKDGITRNYTSARLQTLNTFQFQYGLVEASIQVPAGQGLVAQFWALGSEAYEGTEAWPACGEIDTAEVLGSEPNIVNGTLHAPWPWAPTGIQGQAESATPLSAGFHNYSVEWEPERISFMLDGTVYKTITPADLPAGAAWPFKHPYFLLMDLAVGGEWPGAPTASTHFPAQMLVDWVRVWQ
ncbi:MAG TPA: family 16 glycosylhydrolase [Solirubrobacteraceae bacterium]|jgi:beta-glucanase (GH16 family)|nr:family 16 glycosylhydrolase [Solirubrobacteraceae bacterium]